MLLEGMNVAEGLESRFGARRLGAVDRRSVGKRVSGVGERLLAGRLAVWLREGSCPLSVAWESDVLLWPVSEARIHGSRWKCSLSRKHSVGIWGSSLDGL